MKNLTSIDLASLTTVTGGTSKASATDAALTQQLTTVTSALDDLKRNSGSSQSSMSQMLPIMMMAKMMRG